MTRSARIAVLVLSLILFGMCIGASWGDSPVRSVYYFSYEVDRGVMGFDIDLDVEASKDKTILSVKKVKSIGWGSGGGGATRAWDTVTLNPKQARALHRALGRAMACIDSLERSQRRKP